MAREVGNRRQFVTTGAAAGTVLAAANGLVSAADPVTNGIGPPTGIHFGR
jgi:hypothetical protein